MPQAGMHALAGLAIGRWVPTRAWLMTGIVLGNLLPDVDNLAVAAATLAGLPTHGLHRTFTHSLFTAGAVLVGFYAIARATRQARWGNLGLGLGLGLLMHIGLDLLMWFNGVELLWPLTWEANLWRGVAPAEWWTRLMMPAEFLFFALFFLALDQADRRRRADARPWLALRMWTIVQAGLFGVFTVLVYVMETGFLTIYGALYLASLGLAIFITVRRRETIEGWPQATGEILES